MKIVLTTVDNIGLTKTDTPHNHKQRRMRSSRWWQADLENSKTRRFTIF